MKRLHGGEQAASVLAGLAAALAQRPCSETDPPLSYSPTPPSSIPTFIAGLRSGVSAVPGAGVFDFRIDFITSED